MLFSTLLTSSLLFLLPVSDARPHRAERSAQRRNHSPVQARNQTLEKRPFNGMRATFYDVGLGACGWNNVASDFIVALNSDQFGSGYPGPQCGKQITISYNGNTASAQIADACPTCPYGGLDFSRGLFNHFASEDAGVIYVDWWFNDGSGGGGGGNNGGAQQESSTTTQAPPSSSEAAPTTTEAPPSSSAAASSTITSAASSASGSSSAPLLGVSTNGTVLPAIATMSSNGTTIEEVPAGPAAGNLILLNQVVARLGRIVVVGAESS